MPAEIAGDACRLTDPSDPHQILGPNPAHAGCLTGLYSASSPAATFSMDGPITGEEAGVPGGTSALSLASAVWLSVAALAMLILAGFNSRKRHRQLPMPGLGGTYSRPPETLHTHSEGSRRNED